MIITLLLALVGISFVTWIAFSVIIMWNHRHLPHLLSKQPKTIPKQLPKVSVIIPTRNEANRVKKCVRSLKKQTYPHLEVLIVDDSGDGTKEGIQKIIKDDKRFKIIEQEKLPSGWVGKSHAMHQGTKLANGDWYLFVDADTVHHPELIEKAILYAQHNKISLLSLIPHLTCKTFWEKTVEPVIAGLLLFICPPARVNNPNNKAAMALGPFILMRRAVYEDVGGYENIKNQIADDLEMAKQVKNAGYQIGIAKAQDMMGLRMYEGFSHLWEGWSKNIFWGLNNFYNVGKSKIVQSLIAVGGSMIMFVIAVLPLLAFVFSLPMYLLTGSAALFPLAALSFATWMLATLMQVYTHKQYNAYPLYASLFFLGGIVAIGMFLNSAIRTLAGVGVTWKGRVYSEKILERN